MRRSPFFSPSPFFYDHPRTAPAAASSSSSSFNRPLYHQYPSRPASVITIPVRDASSPGPAPAQPQPPPASARPVPPPSRSPLDPALAANRIQTSFRGFAVRRHKPLDHLRTIANANLQLQNLQSQIQSDHDLPQRIKHDDKERLRLTESVMAILLRLDSVEGAIPEVRSRRKEATRKAVQLQDAIDAMLQENEQIPEVPSSEVNDKIDILEEKERIPETSPAEAIEEMEIHHEKEPISEMPARDVIVKMGSLEEEEQVLEAPAQEVKEEVEKQGPITSSIDPSPDSCTLCGRDAIASKDAEACSKSESFHELASNEELSDHEQELVTSLIAEDGRTQVIEADLLTRKPESTVDNEESYGEGNADMQQERGTALGNVDSILGTLYEQEANLNSSQCHSTTTITFDEMLDSLQPGSEEAESVTDKAPEGIMVENREYSESGCATREVTVAGTDDISITKGQVNGSALADGTAAGPDHTNLAQPDGLCKKMKSDVENVELAMECKRRVCEQQNAHSCSLQEEEMHDVGEVEQKETDSTNGMQASNRVETVDANTKAGHLPAQAESEARSHSGSKNNEVSDRALLEELAQHCLHLRSLLCKLCIQCEKQDKTIASLNSRIGRLERQANSPSKQRKSKCKTRANSRHH